MDMVVDKNSDEGSWREKTSQGWESNCSSFNFLEIRRVTLGIASADTH